MVFFKPGSDRSGSMDLLGLVRGWQFFDHAGHLGGVLFAG